jgi:hypothetical protein
MSAFDSMILPEIHRELANQSDRAAGIIGGAIVEHYLQMAVLTRFRRLSNSKKEDLFDGKGPLATFSAKISIGYALNIYGEKTLGDLNKLNWIRNRFAHKIIGPEWTFDRDEIKQRCAAFQLIDLMAQVIISPNEQRIYSSDTPRDRFVRTVDLLSTQLEGEAIANPSLSTPPMFLVH